MIFARDIIEARLTLDLIVSSDMPKIAWDALEAGMDGPAIRRLAALNSPTYFEVRDILPRAMQEMGLVKLSHGEAALRVAKNRVREILANGEDPLRYIRDFEQLWIDVDYSQELAPLGMLDDEVSLARYSESDDVIRKWVVKRLEEFICHGEAK